MDVLTQAMTRLTEQAKGMTPPARLLAIVALVVVAVSVGWLVSEQSAQTETFLMGGEPFSSAQLRDMESAFGQAGLADYHVDGARIRVPQGEQARYMAALAEAGALPAEFGEYLRKAVDGSGLLMYGPRQEAQLKVAIQSELQGLINHFQGIERSFVQIAEETSRGFPPVKTVTASVGVQPSRNQPIDEHTAAAIRWIVASAWGGLKPEGVTVLDLSSKRLFAGPLDGGAQPGGGGQYAETKRQLERDWQEKIARLLGIPGAIVTTNVELASDGTTRRVSVSVAVPEVYFEEVWRGQQGRAAQFLHGSPDRAALHAIEQSEQARIRQAIVPLLGPADQGADPAGLVAVTTIVAPVDPVLAEPGPQDQTIEWLLANWRTLGLGALVIAALLALRSAAKGAPPAAVPPEHSPDVAHALHLVTDDVPERTQPPSSTPVMTSDRLAGGSLRDELADVVRQDPAAAASVLRTWIGNAS